LVAPFGHSRVLEDLKYILFVSGVLPELIKVKDDRMGFRTIVRMVCDAGGSIGWIFGINVRD
jgi:hypothetical protein